jgi:hypothetical protein
VATHINVDDVCAVLHQPSATLSATLLDVNNNPLPAGQTLHFTVDGNDAGNGTTDASGLATVSYNTSSLAVGDHTVQVSFTSPDLCLYLSTNGNGILGVTYLCFAYQQPINADGSSIFKGGTVPVKVKICDYNGAPVTDADLCVSYGLGTEAVIGDSTEAVSTSAASTGCTMRYDPLADQYIYNWDITGASFVNGTYKIFINAQEGTCGVDHSVLVSVQKVGKGIRK